MTSRPTITSLSSIRPELVGAFDAAERQAHRGLVDWLRETDVASRALRVGDTAPDFLLPDAYGRLHSSEQLRHHSPLVINFFRGGWCPFCSAQLCALEAARRSFDAFNAKIVLLTPDTGHFPRQLKAQLDLDLTILSDVDYGVAVSYGVLFRVPDQIKAHYTALGHDLGARHGSSDWMLPIPATYVVDQGGTIRSAFVEPDYTIRQEADDIVAALRAVSDARRTYAPPSVE